MLLLACVCVLTLLSSCTAVERVYYLAAVEVDWEYAPMGRSAVKDSFNTSFEFIKQSTNRVGSRYKKAVYVQYTNESYTTQVHKPQWMGFLGPILKGEVGDTIIVHFKNLASRPYSVHPHGVLYTKRNEGAIYSDGTHPEDKVDDNVPPGGNHTYIWEITPEFGPSADDKPCIPWAYHSHSGDVTKDTAAGLIGTIITCKSGSLTENNTRKDVDAEFVVIMKVFDENLSWYAADNAKKCQDPKLCEELAKSEDTGYVESNKMHALNGYVFGNGPMFEACSGDKVAWYVIGMGSEEDVHSFMIDGETMLYDGHKSPSVDVYPSKFVSAEMTVTHQGWKLAYCKVDDHFDEGMQAFFSAKLCPSKPETLLEEKTVREKFLLIHEDIWDYLPSGVDKLTEKPMLGDSPEAKYFIGKSTRIGSQYRKARYTEYEDKNFDKVKVRTVDDHHLGLMGPIIRVEVGDILEVTVQNNATKPFSFYPHGLIQYGQSPSLDSIESIPTHPMDFRMYRFYVPKSAGPTDSDTACVTYMYQSAVDPVKDLHSGLFGPLLVCRSGTLDEEGKQIMSVANRDRALFFGVMDENKSWYLDENIALHSIVSRVDKKDPDFIESNKMRCVNGRSFSNLGGMELCRAERVSWHLFSLGEATDVHSIYFHGMDFEYDGTLKDTVQLVPGKSVSFVTLMSHIGNWGIFDRNTDHYKAGLSMVYIVRDCGYLDPALLKYTYLVAPRKRQYYIAAVETDWDYAPGSTSVLDDSLLNDPKSKSFPFTQNDDEHIGTKYRKAVYREFRDSSFIAEKHISVDDDYLGFLGPVIRAEVGDLVEIVFKNMATRTYSMHAHLVNTDKANEGSLYSDRTETKSDDGIPPGGFHVYRWEVTKGPGKKDPDCIASVYYSAHEQVKDAYSGLIGPLIICRKGVLGSKRRRKDVDKEYIMLFSIFDENQSWYFNANVKNYAPKANITDPGFVESNLMHTINGFIYQKLPGMTMHKGDNVAWHLLGYGGTNDIHTVHFHGQTVVHNSGGARTADVVTVFPETSVSVVMKATNPGTWLLHCHVNDHMDAGMETTYTILNHAKP